MNSLRILFPFVGGKTVGGSHISALKLVAGLDRDRFDPAIVLHDLDGSGPGRLGEYINSLGLEYQTLPGVGIIAPPHSRTDSSVSIGTYLTRTLPRLRRFLLDGSYDIVHTNDGRMHVNWATPARLAGCRLLWHHREDPKGFGVNAIAPLLANRVVTVSNFARPARPVLPVTSRTRVIYSPFEFGGQPDREAARAELLKELGAGEDALLLGYFGSLVPRKRPLAFVEAVAATVKALPGRDVRGLLFGEAILPHAPLDREARELAVSLGIGDRVHLMGFRRPIDGPMAAMDATIVTAVNEPFGRTLIEAMHLGVPVIATRHGGNIEAITDGKTGRLVPLDDADAIATALAQLDADPESRAAIVAAARADLVKRYGAERHIEQVSQLYEDLAPAGRDRFQAVS
ncbi:MAG: glycosyltransferase family 4 protein [Dinoroseobacter sp.]|nr:glycosyltransferase family 4 protein [Dinoroseobacter sp.]